VRYLAILLLFCTLAINANQVTDCDRDNCVDRSHLMLSLSLGYGQRSNPLYGGAELPLIVLPDVYYYAEHWFFDNGKLGASWSLNPDWQLSLVGQLNAEKGYFQKWFSTNFTPFSYPSPSSPQSSAVEKTAAKTASIHQVSKRPTAFDAGLQLDWFKHSWHAQAIIWQDISHSYQGQHASISLGKHWQHATGWWQFTGRFYWKSANLMNTYYGINSDTAFNIQPYQAQASWQPEISLQWRQPITYRATLVGLLRYLYLDAAMTNSPLTRSDHITTWFFGVNYRFF
jgi:MipA family protein